MSHVPFEAVLPQLLPRSVALEPVDFRLSTPPPQNEEVINLCVATNESEKVAEHGPGNTPRVIKKEFCAYAKRTREDGKKLTPDNAIPVMIADDEEKGDESSSFESVVAHNDRDNNKQVSDSPPTEVEIPSEVERRSFDGTEKDSSEKEVEGNCSFSSMPVLPALVDSPSKYFTKTSKESLLEMIPDKEMIDKLVQTDLSSAQLKEIENANLLKEKPPTSTQAVVSRPEVVESEQVPQEQQGSKLGDGGTGCFALRRRINQLEEGNKMLKESYKSLLALFTQVSGYAHTQEVDENTGRILSMVEGIKKIDSVTRIRDPVEWIQQIDKFVKVSENQGGNLEKYVSWLGDLLKVLSMSRRESFSVSWEDTFLKVFNDKYERYEGCNEDEMEEILRWIEKGQRLLRGIIGTFNNLKLFDEAPMTRSRFGSTVVSDISILFCKTEKVLMGDKDEKIRKFKKDLERLEELESAVRLYGRKNRDEPIRKFVDGEINFSLNEDA